MSSLSLHLRLALRYAAVLLIALLVLAVGAVVSIDRALRSNLDDRLRTEAFAASSLVDVNRGDVQMDADDREQFLTIMRSGEQAIVTDRKGAVLFSTVTLPPQYIVAAAKQKAAVYDVYPGVRAAVAPIVRDGVRAGSVVVWRPSDWIAQADRSTSAAFLAAALVIAALALAAGDLITRRALEGALERQRRFTSAASHELRAPLAVIRAEADLALRKERSPAEYASSLRTIAAESDALEVLTADLLAAARAENVPARLSRVDAGDLVRGVVSRLMPLAQARNVELSASCEGSFYARCDASAIERALLAVTHNALKYAPGGGHVSLQMRSRSKNIEIEVDDDGPGFSDAALAHGFEPFWREDSARTPGTGLGLALARTLTLASGGTVALRNTPNGSRVILRLNADSA